MKQQRQAGISPKDTMFEGDLQHYFGVGESALRCVRTAMMAVEKSNPGKILDFGSGFGRVLRALKGAFPAAELTACDISHDAIEFCAEAFGAHPVLSCENPNEIELKDRFDLIWCGTLLTQFDAPQFLKFLQLFHSCLAPDGLLVFTTHGPYVAGRLSTHGGSYGMDEVSVTKILSGYDREGFGYADYAEDIVRQVGVEKYGICVSKPSWVCRQIESMSDIRLIAYTERAWDNHQDAVACQNQ